MYAIVIEDIYEGKSTRVRSLGGVTEDFTIRVGIHQGLAFSMAIYFP